MTELEARRLAKFARSIAFNGCVDWYVNHDKNGHPIIVSSIGSTLWGSDLGALMDRFVDGEPR